MNGELHQTGDGTDEKKYKFFQFHLFFHDCVNIQRGSTSQNVSVDLLVFFYVQKMQKFPRIFHFNLILLNKEFI